MMPMKPRLVYPVAKKSCDSDDVFVIPLTATHIWAEFKVDNIGYSVSFYIFSNYEEEQVCRLTEDSILESECCRKLSHIIAEEIGKKGMVDCKILEEWATRIIAEKFHMK